MARWILPCVVMLLVGCGSTKRSSDSSRSWEREIPEGKAVVYFYRPPEIKKWRTSYNIWVDGAADSFTYMDDGGYYAWVGKPGVTTFKARTESERSVTLDLKPGTAHYVLCDYSSGWMTPVPNMKEVSEQDAVKDLAECRPMPALPPGQ